MKQRYTLFETEIGTCAIAWSDRGITRFQLPEETKEATERRIARDSGGEPGKPPKMVHNVIDRVRRHLSGQVQDFSDVEIDLDATGDQRKASRCSSFARRVYIASRGIPAGQTATYGELARSVGCPKAFRAVGRALGKNPIAVIVPCHRVLAAAGKRPGGFSAHGGADTKARLLALEGVKLERD